MNKRSLSILLLSLCLCLGFTTFAQLDSRQRTPETVISDDLTRLPANDSHTYNEVIGEMAATGQKGIEMLAGMLKPAAENQNATYEYAIDAIVSFATKHDNAETRKGIHDGLVAGLKKCTDDPNRAFLLSQLNKIAEPTDAQLYISYLGDSYLKPYALTGLALTPGVDSAVEALINSSAPDAGLAYVAYVKGLKNVEPALLGWTSSTDTAVLEAVYNALATCGTEASVKTLHDAAKAVKFGNDATGATDAYLRLLAGIGTGKAVVNAAKELTKSDNQSVRCTGLLLLLNADKVNATRTITDALKDKDIQYRNTALHNAVAVAGDGIFDAVASKYKSLSPAAKNDVINWIGNNHADSQIALATSAMSSDDPYIAEAAINAASKIGGDKALEALITMLGNDSALSASAQNALLSFNGNISAGILAALNSADSNVVAQALKLASQRHIYDAYDKTAALINSTDTSISSVAIEGLKGVVRPDNFDSVCNILESATDPDAKAHLQHAAKNSIASLDADSQYDKIAGRMNRPEGKKHAALYYPILAQAGNNAAIERLLSEYNAGNASAFDALLQVNNPLMISTLYNLALANPDKKDAIINRFIYLISNSNIPAIAQYELYRNALNLNPSDTTTNMIIYVLSTGRTLPAAMLAARYLDNKATALAAASTVKYIISKEENLQQGTEIHNMLDKARDIFIDFKANDADAGYAADEIAGILNGFNDNGGYTTVAGNMLDGEYENFDFYFDWNGNDPVTVTLRSMPLISIDNENGITYNGKTCPLTNGSHNIHVRMVNDRIFIDTADGSFLANEVVVNPEAGKKAADKGTISFSNPAAVENFYFNHLPDTPVFTLSDEEAAQGFEILFDGRSLDKWHGNTSAYVPVDGNIYVTAQYGGSGNLYTKENYSDFIFRFEFWFDVPAVNNGIGIRTGKDVTGVDAAFHGMEIQVLDHDDPVYQGHPFGYTGLQPYQNHGSIYGVVPSKHVDFGPIKQWHTEEIKAVGDHITVTVDGDVIVDANIREACQGHAVDPDGGKTNPYMIDHRNHPGLFNKEGYISFCGHGPGVKFRNVRILDLSKNKSKKAKK